MKNQSLAQKGDEGSERISISIKLLTRKEGAGKILESPEIRVKILVDPGKE